MGKREEGGRTGKRRGEKTRGWGKGEVRKRRKEWREKRGGEVWRTRNGKEKQMAEGKEKEDAPFILYCLT